jgi:hypothetical protein
VIRRGFWLTAGALAGIYGYRRACAIAHRVSAAGVAAETVRFARDVRDGMELYRLTHSAPAGSTLGTRQTRETRETNHDPRPKEGR